MNYVMVIFTVVYFILGLIGAIVLIELLFKHPRFGGKPGLFIRLDEFWIQIPRYPDGVIGKQRIRWNAVYRYLKKDGWKILTSNAN